MKRRKHTLHNMQKPKSYPPVTPSHDVTPSPPVTPSHAVTPVTSSSHVTSSPAVTPSRSVTPSSLGTQNSRAISHPLSNMERGQRGEVPTRHVTPSSHVTPSQASGVGGEGLVTPSPKNRAARIVRRCTECKAPFYAAYVNALTCSARCRVRRHRRLKKGA